MQKAHWNVRTRVLKNLNVINENKMNKNLNILVTGSTGFVGRHLIRELKKNEITVFEADIKECIDLTNFDSFKVFKKIDVVIHLAAKIYTPVLIIPLLLYFLRTLFSAL